MSLPCDSVCFKRGTSTFAKEVDRRVWTRDRVPLQCGRSLTFPAKNNALRAAFVPTVYGGFLGVLKRTRKGAIEQNSNER